MNALLVCVFVFVFDEGRDEELYGNVVFIFVLFFVPYLTREETQKCMETLSLFSSCFLFRI